MYDAFKENGYNITLIYDDKISSLDSVEIEDNKLTVNALKIDSLPDTGALNKFLLDIDENNIRPASIVVTTVEGKAVTFIALNKTVCTYLKLERYLHGPDNITILDVCINLTELGNDLTHIKVKHNDGD